MSYCSIETIQQIKLLCSLGFIFIFVTVCYKFVNHVTVLQKKKYLKERPTLSASLIMPYDKYKRGQQHLKKKVNTYPTTYPK